MPGAYNGSTAFLPVTLRIRAFVSMVNRLTEQQMGLGKHTDSLLSRNNVLSPCNHEGEQILLGKLFLRMSGGIMSWNQSRKRMKVH